MRDVPRHVASCQRHELAAEHGIARATAGAAPSSSPDSNGSLDEHGRAGSSLTRSAYGGSAFDRLMPGHTRRQRSSVALDARCREHSVVGQYSLDLDAHRVLHSCTADVVEDRCAAGLHSPVSDHEPQIGGSCR